MTSPQETGKPIENATEKLLYEFNTTGGVFRIYEREGGEKYAFELEKSLRSPHGLRLVSTMIGKFLCNLDNETGELARQLYEAVDEYGETMFRDWDRRGETVQRMNNLGEQLLPHLISEGELGGFESADDAVHVVISHHTHKTGRRIVRRGSRLEDYMTSEEKAQLKSLGEF